jgi:two-component system sensor histidine kinase AlgZ
MSRSTFINTKNTLFLPNFCDLKMVFAVVVVGELLAFVLTLAPMNLARQRWDDLAMISLFIQWNALLGSAVLCIIRPLLTHVSNQFAAIISYLLILLIITMISELTYYLNEHLHIGYIIDRTSHWEFLIHNLLIGGIISALALRYFYVQYQWRIKIQTETETKLQLLQARIRPHFLFNSMNTIASLTRTHPETAERITEDLAELFRMLFRNEHSLITWQKERELTERYIDIESQRLGERLSMLWQVDDIPDDAMFPALLLQPLLENAIFHGIEPEINGGTITVKGQLEHGLMRLTIQNTNSQNVIHRQGNQMALENIRERLLAHYQGKARIECLEENEQYYAKITLPYITQEDV